MQASWGGEESPASISLLPSNFPPEQAVLSVKWKSEERDVIDGKWCMNPWLDRQHRAALLFTLRPPPPPPTGQGCYRAAAVAAAAGSSEG